MSLGAEIWQFVLSGISQGAIFALIAVGFVLVHNATGIINFAQGEFAMLGAMLMISGRERGLPFAVALVLALLLTAAIGGLMERYALRPARHGPLTTLMIITLGVDIAFRGLGVLLWGTSPLALAPFSPGPDLHLWGAILPRQGLWVLGLALLASALLYLFFERTLAGTAFRAAVYNRTAARLYGLRPERFAFWALTAAAGLGALAGIVLTPMTNATYDMGLGLGLDGFVAAVLGGLSSLPGAILGGLLLGIFENLAAGFLPSGWQHGIAFLLLLAVLFLRPEGLLGRKGRERV